MENQIIGQLLLAVFLGVLIGIEREYKHKGAGLRTFSLVTLGSCLFTVVSLKFLDSYLIETRIIIDPSRIVQAIAVGVGFIGAGVIFKQGEYIVGLTTAASLWLASAVGIAIGSGFYLEAIFSTLLTVLILYLLGFLEGKIFKTKPQT